MGSRSWVEISLSTIKKNYCIYMENLPKNVDVMAVVKADAYGHGDEVVAKALSEYGVKFFAVSNIDEAIHIRKAGVKEQILILGYTPIERAEELLEFDISQAVISVEYATLLAKTGIPVRCQFAIDTGMRRIGINADDCARCEAVIREFVKKLRVEGLFTHLCVADTKNEDCVEFTKKQIALFEKVVKSVSDLKFPYCHCMNSAGGLWHNIPRENSLARLGIILYGLKPDYSNALPKGIKPALSWKSVVSMVKEINKGDTIGYGRTYCAERSMRIATIPTGYADGYSRSLSNKGYVLINGHKAPIVGRICMDQMMVDVSNVPNVDYETEVTLIGKNGEEALTADDMAQMIGTIGYEIVCGISKRVERTYIMD